MSCTKCKNCCCPCHEAGNAENSCGCCRCAHNHGAHEPHVHEESHKHHHDHAHHDHDDEEETNWVRLGIAAAIYLVALGLNAVIGLDPWIYLGMLVASYLIAGYDILWEAVENLFHGRLFDENFLMAVSSIAAFAIGEYPEAVAVILLYQLGEGLEDKAVDKSRKSISGLMDVRPDRALVLRDGQPQSVAAQDVQVGEQILVKAGEKVPLDGKVVQGKSQLDTSALTGESLWRGVDVGDSVLSGCINLTDALTVEVTRAYGESTASKILELVQNASGNKAPSEQFMTRFARVYTPVVVILAVLLAVTAPLLGLGNWSDWIHRACVFLVISCPCALVISVPLTFFAGIGAASRRGILVKGSQYLESLVHVDSVVLDKTGTITKGEFAVTQCVAVEGVSSDELIACASLVEAMSNHPIARSIVREGQKRGVSQTRVATACREMAGLGAQGEFDGATILAGNERWLRQNGVEVPAPGDVLGTIIHVARDRRYLGYLVIADTLKPDSAQALVDLKKLGVCRNVMLTGDNAKIAQSIAKDLSIDEVHAELLPGDKVGAFEAIEAKKSSDGSLIFVGDGLNDAPVLRRAEVGVAMGALGADAAIEAADVVLMTDDLARLPEAMRIARRTHRIVLQNIVFALAVKFAFLALGALGLVNLWLAVFADVGVMLIAVANATRAFGVSAQSDR